MIARWLPVVGFEGFYEVSDLGDVRGLPRTCRTAKGTRTVPGKTLKPIPHSFGYAMVNLSKGEGQWPYAIHRLVLEAFVGPCPPGMEGCHGKEGVSVNALRNVRWDTHAENMADKVREGTAARGERHGRVKLTEEQARWVLANPESLNRSELGRRLGVSGTAIGYIQSGRNWGHLQGGV